MQDVMEDLRAGMKIHQAVVKYNLSGSVRQRLWNKFKNGG